MAGNVWVLAEYWRGRISDITYEVLALGRELADQLGVKLEAIVLAGEAGAAGETLGIADSVLCGEHPWLAEPVAETYAEALAGMAAERRPGCILVPLSNATLGAGTLLSARLKTPGINFCRNVTVCDGKLQARCTLYGGKMEVLAAASGEPVVFGIAPGARPSDKGRSERRSEVQKVPVTLTREPRIRFLRYLEPEAGDIDITQQDMLVSVGRGIQSQDNFALAEELAEALGGAVCGTRPVVDQGWLPLARQVGKSGMIVKPKLYLAMGISGAPEHQEGMRDSGLIIAVNTDSQAPIFQISHYGVVAPVLDILPVLTEAVRARKQEQAKHG